MKWFLIKRVLCYPDFIERLRSNADGVFEIDTDLANSYVRRTGKMLVNHARLIPLRWRDVRL